MNRHWNYETETLSEPPEGYVAVGDYSVREDSLPKNAEGWAKLGLAEERIKDMGAKELRAFAAEAGGVEFGDLASVKGKEKLKKAILDGVREHNMKRFEADPEAAVKELSQFRGVGGKRFSELIGTSDINLYRSKDASKKWYRRWAKVLHPDNLKNASSDSEWLFNHIKSTYSRMPGGERGKREYEA